MKRFSILVLQIVCIQAIGQPPFRFYTTFGGEGDDVAYSVKPTFDRGYIIAGSSTSYGSHGVSDAYLIKADSMGQPKWTRFIGGSGNEAAKSVIQLPDSGFVFAGYTSSKGLGGYDILIVRLDKNGIVLWENTWGGTSWEFGNDVIQGSDGSLFVVGYTESFGNGKQDAVLLKYSLFGQLLWQKCFGGAQNDEFRSIISTIDGQLATVGYSESLSDSLGDHYFLKLDLHGNATFTKTFGNPGISYLNDLVQFPNGDFILVGAETYTDLPFTQSYRVKISGTTYSIDWEGNSWTYDDTESWRSVTKSIAGSLRTSTLRDFYKDAFEKQGSIFSNTWHDFYPAIVNEFGGFEDEHLYSHEGTPDGGFVCVGSTESFDSEGKDVFLVKLDSTLSNYVSIVDVRNVFMNETTPLIVTDEFYLRIKFNPEAIPRNIEVYNLEGQRVMLISDPKNCVSINKTTLDKYVYFFKFNYPDRNYNIKKVLIR